jgi:hypothetical protein
LRDLVDLSARCLDTGQVRGGRHGAFRGNPRDRRVGAFARRSACSVSDRHEAGGERFERAETIPQLRFHLLGLWRKEFEADADIARKIGEERRAAARRASASEFRSDVMPPAFCLVRFR